MTELKTEMESFVKYLSHARDCFVDHVNEHHNLSTTTRVAAEDILIAYDQLRDRYIKQFEEVERLRGVLSEINRRLLTRKIEYSDLQEISSQINNALNQK